MSALQYTVELDNFSGPLDVLLSFIEKQKLDICDVSLSTVTNDYLEYLQEADLDPHQTNWFLVIATKLILVKSRALLPQEKALEINEEIEDLTEQLKQLAQYKHAASALERDSKHPLMLRPKEASRGRVSEYTNINPESIQQAFTQLLNEPVNTPKQTFRLKRQTDAELRNSLLTRLVHVQQLQLNNIHSLTANTKESVTLFMLILELIKSKQAKLFSTNGEYTVGMIS